MMGHRLNTLNLRLNLSALLSPSFKRRLRVVKRSENMRWGGAYKRFDHLCPIG